MNRLQEPLYQYDNRARSESSVATADLTCPIGRKSLLQSETS